MGRSRPAVGYAACMIPVGIFYLMTAGDIGKSVIGLWGAVAVLCGAAAVMAAVRSEGRQIAQFMCALLAAMQLPCL